MSGSDNGVISEFQRRRRLMLLNFGFSMALFALALLLAQFADSFPGFLGIERRGWTAGAIAQFIAGVVFAVVGFLQYRCPACNSIMRGQDKYPFGVVLDPDNCPKCGARLKA